jgi:hypothetical protein
MWVEEIPVNYANSVVQGKTPQQDIDDPDYVFRFGGLDLAKRVDHSAFELLRLMKEVPSGDLYLQEEAFMEWPHVSYSTIAKDMLKIHTKFPMEQLGFDRSGVGDAASELFDKSALPMVEIVTTQQRKLDIIKIVKGLMEQRTSGGTPKLVIDKSTELRQQALEQETIITQAGNETYKHPPNRHDDRFWALGYACFVALPYVIGYPPPVIRRIGVEPQVRDIDDEIDRLLSYS